MIPQELEDGGEPLVLLRQVGKLVQGEEEGLLARPFRDVPKEGLPARKFGAGLQGRVIEMLAGGRGEGRRDGSGTRDAGVRLSAPCEGFCDPGMLDPGRRGDHQMHILARRRGRKRNTGSI